MTTSDNSTTSLRYCSKCRRELPATKEFFYLQKGGRGGFTASCKECMGHPFGVFAVPKPSTKDGFRRCSRCQNELPATTEYFHPHKKYGLQSRCRACALEENKQWRLANPERHLENNRKWVSSNKERRRAINRRWHRKDKNKGRESRRLAYQKRRSNIMNVPDTFSPEHKHIALEYFHGRCAVCERQLKDLFGTHTLHWDHWIPLSKGGSTTPDNMLPLCGGLGGCNTLKNDSVPIEWLNSRYSAVKVKRILDRINRYFEIVRQGG